MFINPLVSEADRSVRVVAEVDNAGGTLKGGLFVKGRIKTGQRTGVLKVPRMALLSWDVQGKRGELFVVREGIAQRKTVHTDRVAEDMVEIGSGLMAGDQVITRGGFNVKDGDKVNVTRINGEK